MISAVFFLLFELICDIIFVDKKYRKYMGVMDLKASETAALIEVIQEQNKTIAALRITIEEMNSDSKILREQIDYLTRKLFGSKSEKTSALTGQIVMDEILDYGQFDEAEVEAGPFEIEPILKKTRTKKGYSREKALLYLPSEDKVYTLPEEDQVCPVDGDKLSRVGKKYLRTEIEYTPATMKLVHLYRETWECRTCRTEGRKHLREALVDEPVLQHSMASASSVAWTMYQKYVNHVPLYRQEKDWQNLGMEIKRSTLSNWIIKTSEEWLSKIVARLHEKLLEEKYIHADETTIQVLGEEGRKNTSKSYMWVYTTTRNSEQQIRLFDYRSGRAGKNAAEFLEGFSGYLHTDAFSGYVKVKGVVRCLCWSHSRRYYANALPKDLKSEEATLPRQGIAYCNELFKIEEKLRDLSPENRKIQRLKLETPLLEAYWSWVDRNTGTVLAKSKIGQAFQYALNQKTGLMNYLEDGHCEISNNIAENSIWPFTVGRRNWLFSGSPDGAAASAIVYSLVETAKANGLNPYKYLNVLLRGIPKFSTHGKMDLLDSLLPWDPQIKKACAIK